MKDVSSLFEAFKALPEKKAGIVFSGTEILHVGPSSIALADAKHVTKIIVRNHAVVTPVEEEFKTLERFGCIKGELFLLPQAVAWGQDPDYLTMTRLGPCLGYRKPDEGERVRAAEAIGEFAARIWESDQLVHTDISLNNLTVEPKGKIGIIDLAAVKKAEFPEEMFWQPLLIKAIPCASIASIFTEQTGIPVSLERVERMAKNRFNQFAPRISGPQAEALWTTIQSNLTEWKEAEHCQRSGSCRRKNFRCTLG
jgi:hypothetical protein